MRFFHISLLSFTAYASNDVELEDAVALIQADDIMHRPKRKKVVAAMAGERPPGLDKLSPEHWSNAKGAQDQSAWDSLMKGVGLRSTEALEDTTEDSASVGLALRASIQDTLASAAPWGEIKLQAMLEGQTCLDKEPVIADGLSGPRRVMSSIESFLMCRRWARIKKKPRFVVYPPRARESHSNCWVCDAGGTRATKMKMSYLFDTTDVIASTTEMTDMSRESKWWRQTCEDKAPQQRLPSTTRTGLNFFYQLDGVMEVFADCQKSAIENNAPLFVVYPPGFEANSPCWLCNDGTTFRESKIQRAHLFCTGHSRDGSERSCDHLNPSKEEILPKIQVTAKPTPSPTPRPKPPPITAAPTPTPTPVPTIPTVYASQHSTWETAKVVPAPKMDAHMTAAEDIPNFADQGGQMAMATILKAIEQSRDRTTEAAKKREKDAGKFVDELNKKVAGIQGQKVGALRSWEAYTDVENLRADPGAMLENLDSEEDDED